MSDRIEIKDDGYSVVIKPQGKGQVRLFVNDTDSITQKTISAIRQQQADIEKLRAELEFSRKNLAHCSEIAGELRAELAAIKAAPRVAVIIGDENCRSLGYAFDLPPVGTELIARPTK